MVHVDACLAEELNELFFLLYSILYVLSFFVFAGDDWKVPLIFIVEIASRILAAAADFFGNAK